MVFFVVPLCSTLGAWTGRRSCSVTARLFPTLRTCARFIQKGADPSSLHPSDLGYAFRYQKLQKRVSEGLPPSIFEADSAETQTRLIEERLESERHIHRRRKLQKLLSKSHSEASFSQAASEPYATFNGSGIQKTKEWRIATPTPVQTHSVAGSHSALVPGAGKTVEVHSEQTPVVRNTCGTALFETTEMPRDEPLCLSKMSSPADDSRSATSGRDVRESGDTYSRAAKKQKAKMKESKGEGVPHSQVSADGQALFFSMASDAPIDPKEIRLLHGFETPQDVRSVQKSLKSALGECTSPQCVSIQSAAATRQRSLVQTQEHAKRAELRNSSSESALQNADTANNVVARLKAQALQKQDVCDSLLTDGEKRELFQSEPALNDVSSYFPGKDTLRRRKEMLAFNGSISSLFQAGIASRENINLALKAFSVQGNLDKALNEYDEAVALGFTPDSETFVSLLQGAAQKCDAAAARLIYLKMRSRLIDPTCRVYGALIHAHVREGDIVSGFSLLRKMEQENLKPDVVIYTTLIDGLVQKRRCDEAWDVFREMRTWKLINPDEVLFTVMIKACAVQNEPEKAFGLLDDLRMSGLHPTHVTYEELARACCKDPHLANKAFSLANQMEAEDMPWSIGVYEALLEACATLGDINEARRVLEHRDREENDCRSLLSPACYRSLLRTLTINLKKSSSKKGQGVVADTSLRQAWAILANMRQHHPEAIRTPETLNEVVRLYTSAKQYQFAVDILQHFSAARVEPSCETYSILLEMYYKQLNDPGRFFSLWDFVRRETQVVPSEELFYNAVSFAIKICSKEKVLMLLEDMYHLKIYPSVQLTAALSRYGKHMPELTRMMLLFVKLEQSEAKRRSAAEAELNSKKIQEHELRQYQHGRTAKTVSLEDRVRREYFDKQKQGDANTPRLPRTLYQQLKRRGGEYYASLNDHPPSNPAPHLPLVSRGS